MSLYRSLEHQVFIERVTIYTSLENQVFNEQSRNEHLIFLDMDERSLSGVETNDPLEMKDAVETNDDLQTKKWNKPIEKPVKTLQIQAFPYQNCISPKYIS